jgi:fatty acid synthase subunit beta
VVGNIDNDTESADARVALLQNVLKHFTSTYLWEKDIHTLASAFDTETRKTVLTAYYKAVAYLKERGIPVPSQPKSALLEHAGSGKASIFALFGGQGSNEVYFDELQNLYDIYEPFVAPFVEALTSDILVSLAKEEQHTPFYTYGLNVASWLSGAVERPNITYLASIPVSFPLIGLTQLVQYLVSCHVLNLTPGEFRRNLAGATGHSQGIVSAVVVAASSTFEEFIENTRLALKWLFFSGLRGQQAFPVTALEPGIVQDSLQGGEGPPSPMLSVTGLSLKELESHVVGTNEHLPRTSRLQVSLHNGPKAFVVTGPPKSLYGLVTSLRKVKASSGLDQSKVPFSQRKPVFSTRFLVVGVPYHSDYIAGATEKVVEEDLDGDELWDAEELEIPVYNTEDGNFLSVNLLLDLIDILRFRYARSRVVLHTFTLPTDFYFAYKLGQSNRFPRIRNTRH